MHTRDQGKKPFVRALTFTLHYTDVVDYKCHFSVTVHCSHKKKVAVQAMTLCI